MRYYFQAISDQVETNLLIAWVARWFEEIGDIAEYNTAFHAFVYVALEMLSKCTQTFELL